MVRLKASAETVAPTVDAVIVRHTSASARHPLRYLSTFLFEGVNDGSDDDWLTALEAAAT